VHNNVSHICRPTKNPILSTCRGTLCSIILPVAECIITVVLAQQYTGFMEMILSSCFGTELSYRYTQYPIPGYAHHKLKKKSTPHNSHLPLITGNHISQFHIPFFLMHFPRHTCPDTYVPNGPYHNVPISRGFQGSMVVLAFVAPVRTGWPQDVA
jgi:hypothetical protein